MDDVSTLDSMLPEDEGIYFPLSQPELPTRPTQACASASVQRRRRSAACCSAPYIAASQEQKLAGPFCAALGSGVYRQHTPRARRRSPMSGASEASVQHEGPSLGDEAERVARELAEAALASAQALAADANAVDPGYTAKPTAFLYKGHTAQIATSTAGMYGEMIESFIKQVVAHARRYGADRFSVFCDLGSGRGAPSAIAAYEHDWLACLAAALAAAAAVAANLPTLRNSLQLVLTFNSTESGATMSGIEKCPQAFGLSLETQRLLLLRETSDRLRSFRVPTDSNEGSSGGLTSPAEAGDPIPLETVRELFGARPRRAVAFAHDDLSAFADLEGVTHAYSFDAAMEGPLINQQPQASSDAARQSGVQLWARQTVLRQRHSPMVCIRRALLNFTHTLSPLCLRADLISRFDLKGADIKCQISSNMWVSSEGRTAYVYVKTDWKQRQQMHRRWLSENILQPQLQQQARQQQLLRHVRVQQQLVLQQLQREDDQPVACAAAAAAAAAAEAQSPLRTPRSSRRSSLSPLGTSRCRSTSRKRHSTAAESQQQQQQMVLFHLAARRQQLQVLDQLEPAQAIWGKAFHQQQQIQHEHGISEGDDEALFNQLRSFRSTHVRLSKWHQPLNLRSLLLVSLLPFEGQNQWLQLQQQLLQPGGRVLTRAQRLLLLGYDESQRKDEELQRDRWLEQLAAAAGAEEAKALKANIRDRLTEQRMEDMSLFSFLPPDESACTSSSGPSSLPDGATLRHGFRHSLQELQERQSPLRTPRRSATQASLTSQDSSPVWTPAPDAESPAATAAVVGASQQLPRGQRRSPVRQGCARNRRSSSHSVSSVFPRRSCGATAAAAALAAADAAAAASPIHPKAKAYAVAATPPSRRAVHKVERGLRSLGFRGSDAACGSSSAPMSQDAP
ncbi:hypothetical protein Emag_000293 [Eimeria magna]